MTLGEIWRRLHVLLQRDRFHAELEEEMRLHRELRGDSKTFGNPGVIAEESRDAWGARWLDHLSQDLRYAVRGLRNKPGFTLAVTLTLALGIGANTAMFSVVDRLLFRPPALLRDPNRVHRLYFAETYQGEVRNSGGVQFARYLDLNRLTHAFERTAVAWPSPMAIGVGVDAREMQVAAVSASFFGFFDAPPVVGRYFTNAEDTIPQGAAVAVLGYGLWQTQYGGSTDVLGKTIQIGATQYTIIGVAPQAFVGLWVAEPPAAYIPITTFGAEMGAASRRRGEIWWSTYLRRWAWMIAERRPGVTVEAATTDVTAAFIQSLDIEDAQSPNRDRTSLSITKPHGVLASILSERGPNESADAKIATWLGGVALIVLLIACANVANLLLARALQRRREIAIRLALGVSRRRLASHLLNESLLLALLGGVAGLIVAQFGGAILRASLLPKAPQASVITDPRTLVAVGAATLLAGFLTGLAPVLQSRRIDLTGDLKAGAREGAMYRSRIRMGLLILQGALSVVLLVGAGLFVRSLGHVREVPLGFDPGSVSVVDLQMRGVKLDSASGVALRRRLLADAQTIPGVTHVSRQASVPLWRHWAQEIRVPGIDSTDRLGTFYLNAVTPDYFATMGTKLLRGRGITEADVAGAPRVMIVSQAMADVLWPGKDALGQCVRLGTDTVPCTTVVGVAENIKSEDLDQDPGYYYYLSSDQFEPDYGGLLVRTAVPGAAARNIIRKRLQSTMPGPSYVNVTPLSEVFGNDTRSWRLGAMMFSVFGLLALALAAVGLYSVVAHNVALRIHEMGVRVALGAEGRDLVRLVLSEGLLLASIGIVLGGAVAVTAAPSLKSLLFEESPRDPAVLIGVALILLVVAALASLAPARRASRVDPIQALRSE